MASGWFTPFAGGTDDCFGHGTRVAALAAGSFYGSAKSATIVPVNVDDNCDGGPQTDDTIDGLEWILNQQDPYSIVNMSLSKNGGSSSLDEAVQDLLDENYIVVAGAGNDNDDACEDSPGRLSGVITVGATNINDQRWDSSNFGSCIDLFAPGENITTAGNDSDSDVDDHQNGTSLAAPIVSGIAYAIQTERQTAPSNVLKVLVGDILAGTTASAIAGQLSGIGAGSPNLLIYGPRSYTQIIGTRQVTVAQSYTWLARAYGGDEAEFEYVWQTSLNGSSWTTVSTTDQYQRSFAADDEFTLYMRLTVTSEFGDERTHEIEIDVDVPCATWPMCPE